MTGELLALGSVTLLTVGVALGAHMRDLAWRSKAATGIRMLSGGRFFRVHDLGINPSEALENDIEAAFWEFDDESKRTGACRDAFKGQARKLVRMAVEG